MGYTHLEITPFQTPKRAGLPCGDVVQFERMAASTVVVISDGLGSGIKANLAATLCVSRLLELIRQGYSLREAFGHIIPTMNDARGTDMPYAVFSVMQFRHDGETSILSYEMPPPIYVGRRVATVLHQQTTVRDDAVIGEANCYLEPGEGVLLVSDGITQAGLGQGIPMGWEIEGAREKVQELLAGRTPLKEIPRLVHQEARRYWGRAAGDDCTAVLAWCRTGAVVNILTGPPANPALDGPMVRRFLDAEGSKVICGGTTAKIVADRLGKPIQVAQQEMSLIAPPSYAIEGIDLVTEGAVTLNQAFNILEADEELYDEESGVTRLCRLLKNADRINILVGSARNIAEGNISFRQQGILPRQTIVRLLAQKLLRDGKYVTIESV